MQTNPQTNRAAPQVRPVVQRDDGLRSIGWYGDAPGTFDRRTDAARIANGDKPVPARNFRRIKIREVRSNAPA